MRNVKDLAVAAWEAEIGAVADGSTNVATTAESCRELVKSAAHEAAEVKRGAPAHANRLLLCLRDLARTMRMLEALRDRATTGRIVDLETLGIWDEIDQLDEGPDLRIILDAASEVERRDDEGEERRDVAASAPCPTTRADVAKLCTVLHDALLVDNRLSRLRVAGELRATISILASGGALRIPNPVRTE